MKPSVRASFVTVLALFGVLLLAPGAEAMTTSTQQDGLTIDWHKATTSGMGKPEEYPAAAYANGTYVLSEFTDTDARILVSSDARNWSVAWKGQWVPGPIVSGGPGFVAWSRGILLSTTGHHWTQANGAVPARLLKSEFVQLGSVGGVVVAFPDSGRGFWSADGHNWHALSSGPQSPITLAGDAGHLWALTGGHNYQTGTNSPVKLWVTADGKTWSKSAQLPNSAKSHDLRAAFGPLGGVVIGGSKAWYASDDVHWTLASNTPSRTQKGPASVDDVIADASGFIVTAHRDPPGCVLDPAQRRALTWTSVDGSVWRKMSSTGWLGREIDHLFISGRTLIGIGIHWVNEPGIGQVWTAHLPNIATDNAPPPPPVNNPGPQGC